MKDQIVLSIDPTNIPHNAIHYAEELARAGQKELLIYSVQGMPVLSHADGGLTSPGLEYVPGAVDEMEQMAQRLYEEVQGRYPYVKLEHGPGFQAPATIHKMEEIEGEPGSSCMLIMPKTHEHTWWNNAIGTTETAVAAEVKCPVLFLPEGVEYKGISRIMYLADTQALVDGQYKGFRFLRRFADAHNATIVVGFVNTTTDEARENISIGEAMEAFKQRLPFQFKHEYHFFQHHNAEEILSMANLTHTDIVAFPFREASFFQRFFENEITRSLVLKADMPVLVF